MKFLLPLILIALLFDGIACGANLRYWIEPCSVEEQTGCRSSDLELATWALEAWQAAAKGVLRFEKTEKLASAQIRVHWTNGKTGLYGEARPILVDGVRGAEVFVLPPALPVKDEDPLLRETIVYLTCLHETGHALGLEHTSAFADIMYSFQYGGNIAEYFGRYRRQLTTRIDIRKHSGISDADQKQVIALWR